VNPSGKEADEYRVLGGGHRVMSIGGGMPQQTEVPKNSRESFTLEGKKKTSKGSGKKESRPLSEKLGKRGFLG